MRTSDLQSVATDLHQVVLRLLRQLRIHDLEAGTTSARLSVLSLLVFAGLERPSDLARAEQVSVPTISRMLKGMEEEGLVRRRRDPGDGRAARILATARGRRIIEAARRARLDDLVGRLGRLSRTDQRRLRDALPLLRQLL